MAETFHTLIARNKRNSWLLIFLFALLLVGMGVLIGSVWRPGNLGFAIAVGVIAAIVAFLLTLAGYYKGGSAVLAISGAHQIQKSDDPQLFNVVEEVAIAAGVPMPKVYVIDEPAPNAFATGRNPENAVVAITTGLRQKLTRDELQGVMAHEMGHVRNYDILFAMMMAVMVGTVVMLSHVFLRSLWFGGGRRRRSSQQGGGGAGQLVLLVAALVLAILAPLLAKIIQMAMSRQREYLADSTAVEFTRNPEGLAHALAKISNDPEDLKAANKATAHMYIVQPLKNLDKRASSVFSTHPPIRDRIERLLALTR